MDKAQQKILTEYISYLVEHKERPASVSVFTDQLKYQEGTFYKYFKSFRHLEKSFWKILFDDVIEKIEAQEVFHSYSVNEKLLAFYFTWIEELKAYREYAVLVSKREKIYELYPADFELFKQAFQEFVGALVLEGISSEEIANRQLIVDKYKYMMWIQPVSIFKFWIRDGSENFEDTDALIEKTVNFSFDLMRSNGMDSFFDLAKFHIQHF
jgi:AcrR family transcriptional regulator